MLNLAVRNTRKLVRETSKAENIRLGRFFTKKPTAALMAGLFTLTDAPLVSILDPGAGTGILSAALVEALCRRGRATEIHLVCYENNARYLPVLKNNLDRLRRKCRREYGVKLAASVLEENYVLAQRDSYTISFFSRQPELFDFVIMNPPSELIEKDSPEALCAQDICPTAVNLNYLFAAMAMQNLRTGGEMVALLPTVFATAVQLSKIRCSLLSQSVLERVHLFTDKSQGALKNSLVIKLRKGGVSAPKILLSVSTDDGTPEQTTLLPELPYSLVVREEDKSLLLFKSEEELKLVRLIESLPSSFAAYGLRMKTGLTLLSRYPNLLSDTPGKGTVPLIHPRSIQDGRVVFPQPIRHQYLTPTIPSLVQKNKNMLLIKRFPAKAEQRKLVCGVYLASQLPNSRFISTHNKLNYVDMAGEAEMDAPFLYGLYAFLSSAVVDSYIRIISKSGQINATELSDLPLPAAQTLREMGQKLIAIRVYSLEYCDKMVAEMLKQSRQKAKAPGTPVLK
ncbi:MAG: hypothetical protein WDA00_05860 [Eubacteriales bacterium]